MTTRHHPIEAEELMAYLDGELAPDQAAIAAAHLETCMECQQIATDLRGVSQTLNTWELQATNSLMPKSLAAAVEEHLPDLQPTFKIPTPWYRRPWLRSWAPALAGSALVATVIVSSLTLKWERYDLRDASAVPRLQSVDPTRPPMAAPSKKKTIASDPNGAFDSGADKTANSFSLDAQALNDHQLAVAGGIIRGARTGEPSQPQQSVTMTPTATFGATADTLPTSPMIIRTAELSLTTQEFDKGRAQVEDILKRHHGYIGSLNVTGAASAGRTLTASLRIPSTQLDTALTELKSLGRLVSESKTGQEVTAQYVDLQARLTNSRNTEKRLIDLLQNRTGKLSDVLEVENELARVRGEVESMEAERKNLSNQVDFATLNLTLTEDYRAQLQVVPPSTTTRLSNAAVEGYRSMVDGLMSVALFFLSAGPTLLLWTAVLILPARLLWKRLRRASAQ